RRRRSSRPSTRPRTTWAIRAWTTSTATAWSTPKPPAGRSTRRPSTVRRRPPPSRRAASPEGAATDGPKLLTPIRKRPKGRFFVVAPYSDPAISPVLLPPMKRPIILLLLAFALPLGAAPIKRYIVTLQPVVSASSTRS